MTLCKRFAIALTSCVLVGSTAGGQTTWFVDLANCPGPGSGTQVDPFCVIQDGIDAAIDGDEVVVADGTYAGSRNTNLNFGGRLITVRSASGDPTLCTIHGGFANRGFIFNTGETNAAIVSGLTIDTGVGAGPDGGGAFHITSASPTITNCIMVNSFTDDDAKAGSIYILNGDPVITGCTFTNSFSHGPGGAIYCDNASPTISDCVFSDSFSGTNGGAIYCAAGSNPSITDCMFEDSSAITDGGAIYSTSGSSPNITGCTFINNRTINGSGGAMFNFESDLQLAGCGFTGNSSPNGFGAAIFISRSSGSIIGCDFEGNSALFGGALRLRENSSPTIEDCTFVGNVATALNGGAIDSFGGSSPTITGCLFESNVAAQFGGAIVNHTQANAIISGCTFDRNHAATEGGAIFTFASSPSVSTTTFTGNTAGLQGGAVYNNAADLTLDDCTFNNNQAGVGTGECPAEGDGDSCSGPRVVNEGTFGGSTVGNTGTDVTSCTSGDTLDEWFCYTPTCSGTATASLCSNTNFDTSLAVFEECGGTELACSDDFCGLQSRVDWPVTAGTPYFVRVAGFGGATGDFELQISCSPDATIGDGGAMQSVNASTVIATNTFFTGNTASDLGGAVSSEDSDISCANCTFQFNQAESGAGAFIRNATDSSLTDCTFENNTAEIAGGGAYVVGSTLSVTGCEFLHNAATFGGGMENSDSNTVVTASRFIENTADRAGGMHNILTDSIVTGCTFLGNTALTGGGMDNNHSSPTVTDCFFLANKATDAEGGAGMINASSSQPDIVNCVFSGNVAPKGAALRNLGASSTHVVNCSFSNNASDAGSGVIDSGADSGVVLRNSIVWGNQGESFSGDGSANVSNSIVQGGVAGVLVFDVNPLFIDADGPDSMAGTEDDNLRVILGSPAIDFGDNAAVPVAVTTDLNGSDRFIDGDDDGIVTVDLGAYEFDGLTSVYVLNLTQDTTSESLALAIRDAVDADDLLASPAAFGEEPEIDFKGKAISLRSVAAIDQASGGLIIMADGSVLESALGANISLAGELRVPSGDAADVIADQLITMATGRIVVRPGAGLFVTAVSGATLDGETSLFSQSTLAVVGDATNGGTMTLLSHATLAVGGQFLNNGSLGSSFADLDIDLFRNAGSAVLLGITLFAEQLVNDTDGTLIAYGEIIADVLNDGSATYTADTLVVGDYTNNGTTNVQGGTLTILGSLINNGTIVGDVASDAASRSAPNNGLSIGGDYIAGPTAAILMPDPSWTVKVGGNFDVAIEDNQRYDMATAKLSISPSSSEVKTFELMSTDIGADPSGLDRSLPGHFPIGTLHIGPSASVQLVDLHDNDALGQASCEALYVRDLSIESGALLNTGSCNVYYVHFTGPGMVDDPANLRQIVILPGDGDGDGQVNLQD
ncbi:MAG: hypothetical protein IH897_07940, partial [Planctomycetes bacterium]|nr:hypothetical protein [Planctomycetota bacterium]